MATSDILPDSRRILRATTVKEMVLSIRWADGSTGDFDLRPEIFSDRRLVALRTDAPLFAQFAIFAEQDGLEWPGERFIRPSGFGCSTSFQ